MTTQHDAHVEGSEHEHPGERTYVGIFVILVVITGVEVALSYVKVGGSQLITNSGLLVLAAVKFSMVVAYFMHLKFDNKVLRVLFVGGLILAILVYVAYLFTLHAL
jgi:cytochrome c oxidase subunit 4